MMSFDVWQFITTFLDDTDVSIIRMVCKKFYKFPGKKIFYIKDFYQTKELAFWALNTKSTPKSFDIKELVKFNDIDLLNYALNSGYKWTYKLSARIAEYGLLELLKYAHKNLFPWNEFTTSNAAKFGHLDCLIYAHTHGCPWNSFVIINSIIYDRYECFIYAIEHKCPRAKNLANLAMSYGRIKHLQYLHNNKLDTLEGQYINTKNVKYLTLSYIKYLYKHKIKWTMYTCSEFAGRGTLDCLEFARSHGCNWDENVYLMAAINGQQNCLEFAYRHHCPLKSQETYNYILRYGTSECSLFIKDRFGSEFSK